MTLRRIRELEADASLREEGNFLGRAKAADNLELEILHQLEGGDGKAVPAGETDLRREAETLLARWQSLDEAWLARVRTDLRSAPDPGALFRSLWETRFPASAFAPSDRPEYDARDAFLNGLLYPGELPEAALALEPEMVPFQKTPVCVLLELIKWAGLGPEDLFCDIGSGLGQIPIATHLLTGARAMGIEREPAYAAIARACAESLGLGEVRFACQDARSADYAGATVLFLYTPFRGRMLAEVLERIRNHSRAGTRLFAYGPCIAEIAGQPRLSPAGPVTASGLAAFRID